MTFLAFFVTLLMSIDASNASQGYVESTDHILLNDISMKSKLNRTGDKLLIKIQLNASDQVGFILRDREEDKAIFQWNDQELDAGSHELALPLPELSPAVYIIELNTSDQLIRHYLVLKN